MCLHELLPGQALKLLFTQSVRAVGVTPSNLMSSVTVILSLAYIALNEWEVFK